MNVPGLDRLGMAGVIGIGCLLFSIGFYFNGVAPAIDQLRRLDGERRQLETLAGSREQAREVAGAGRGAMPAITDAPDVLKQLVALFEKNRLAVDSMSYAVEGDAEVRKLEVDFPLRVSYPVLRAHLRDALALSPTASLDELVLQRPRADDAMLEAQVRLSYRFHVSP